MGMGEEKVDAISNEDINYDGEDNCLQIIGRENTGIRV